MTSDSISAPGRRIPVLVVLLMLPVLVTVALRWPRTHGYQPNPADAAVVESSRSPIVTGIVAPRSAHSGAKVPSVATREQPWWALLSPEELEYRRADFDDMYESPGAFPEFSELVRQLTDAGVPLDIVRLESREILGTLLQRRQFGMAAAQFDAEAQFVSHPAGKLVKREMARIFGEKAAVAEAELFSRLTNNGVALDSVAARRILQLAPTNPLRSLGPVPASVVRPEDEPAPDGGLSPMPDATDNPQIPPQAQGNPPLTAARIPVPDREPGDEPPPESAPTP